VRIAHVGTGSAPLQGATVPEGSSSLDRFTIDFTARARDGEIDPVFGRGVEIRQMVDILARRRKNNPIVVGDPGVGKTALIEGLALEIANETAPESLRGVRLLSLDMGLLQAGAGVKGEFENRLKEVIHEVKSSEIPIVLFIDEAHTMIGAGGAQGGGDAANLLKPALARGELRTIAATTWSEYKKYFEKDPALSRRFQLVKVDEPDEDNAIGMLRGIAPYYEESHGVRIFDEAVVACAQLGSRYVSGRQHPDKGVDLLDTAAARVKLAHSAVPPEIEALERQLDADRRTEAARVRDQAHGVEGADDGAEERSARIAATSDQLEQLRSRWNVEREAVARLVAARAKVSEVEEAAGDGSEALGDALKELEAADLAVKEAQSEGALIAVDVDAETVAAVVGDWTGIPVGSMVRDEIEAILSFDDRMKARIKGQDHAIEALSKAIRASKAGVGDPEAPIGVVLAVGTSGVGKTECGLGLADLLFGGDRFLTTINMSEYQEKHTVSRLIGSPPGYVGYGEGGRLTEAVRKAPYSVVLLDEVEKADPEVMNLFYQVFDKGVLNDSEGRQVNFRNTILYLTSNLGTDLIHKMCESGVYPSVEELREALHPTLAAHFKPALLARMTVIPFFPIDPDVMGEIARLKLNKVVRRIREAHRLELSYGDEVIDSIVEQCAQVDTGARNIDHILRGSLMPQLSTEILTRMATGLPETCVIGFDETEGFTFAFGE
ncbi:MAG: type VI secretion system ATPase TssH, partial [Planctomycetota bacterium]